MYEPMLSCRLEDHWDAVVYPGYVQPKINGVRCQLTSDGFFSKKKIPSVPHLETLALQYFPETPLDGYLYSENCLICYYICDIANDKMFFERHLELITSFLQTNTNPRIALVETLKVLDRQDLENKKDLYIAQGYNGLIYYNPRGFYECGKRSEYRLEYIKQLTEDVMCVGFREAKKGNKLGALECTAEDGAILWVGTGFTEAQRVSYWENREDLLDRIITIKHRGKENVFVCIKDMLFFPERTEK